VLVLLVGRRRVAPPEDDDEDAAASDLPQARGGEVVIPRVEEGEVGSLGDQEARRAS
jgi:hypothetical protein